MQASERGWGPREEDAELYDLVDDPRQRFNLARDPLYAETRARLARLLNDM